MAVFDCDGTLVDSLHSIVSSIAAASSALGIEAPDSNRVRRIIGLPLEVGIGHLFPDLGAAEIAAMREHYRQTFSGLRTSGDIQEPLYPGVLETLTRLQNEGWMLAIATGKSHKGLVDTLAAHDLESRFLSLQTADRAAGKPDPEMIHNAILETGADASATVMIGDTTFDMEMAHNAGVLAIGVAWGYHQADELSAAGCQRVVRSFTQLPATLDEMTAV